MNRKPKSSDVIFSKRQWEKIHKKEKLRDYKKDETTLSYKKFLDKYKKYFKKGIFLDLGCGIAHVSAMLAGEGIKIIGVDISEEAILKSKILFKKDKLKGRFIQADLLKLPLKDKSIKFIYSCMSLEYVKNTQGAVDEAYRVLERGGRVIAVLPVISFTTLTYHQTRGDIPDIFILKSLMEWIHFKLLKGKYMNYGYEKSFSVSNVRKLFVNSGFKIIEIDFFDMHYPISFIPSFIRPHFKKLLRLRPFWPLIYIEAKK